MSDDEDLERRLRAEALRPCDPEFTQRVMRSLPRRPDAGLRASLGRSFVMTTRVAMVLALTAAAQRWYIAGSGSAASFLVLLLIAGPLLAALSQLCGAPMPRRVWQLLRPRHRNWR
jgi:hypothetical protein